MKGWWIPVAAVLGIVVHHVATRLWWTGRITARLSPPTPRGRRLLVRVPGQLVARLERRACLADDVAPTLDDLARSTAAGSTLTTAIEGLGPARRARPFAALLGTCLVDHRLGASLGDALAIANPGTSLVPPQRRSPRRRPPPPSPEPALGLAVLELAARHGGATAASLDRAASAVRERRAVIAERAVQSAQARLSALVLTLLPIGFAVWTASTDRRVARFLAGSPLGWACLGVGLTLNLAGWAWMRLIIRGRP